MSYNLERFKKAQAKDYAVALQEIRNGRKRSHWMWYIFPQCKGLGHSSMADYYGINSIEEAKAYLADAILSSRLIEISEALMQVEKKNADEIFGFPDNLKLQSSMTLFASVSEQGSVFHRVLDAYYSGKMDEKTVKLLGME